MHSTKPADWQTYGGNVLGMMDVSDELSADGEDSVYLKMDDRPYRINRGWRFG